MSRGQNFEAAARDSSAFLSLIRCRLSMFGSCVSKLATENFDFRKKILSRWISNYVKTSSTLSFFRPGYICVVFSFQQSILKWHFAAAVILGKVSTFNCFDKLSAPETFFELMNFMRFVLHFRECLSRVSCCKFNWFSRVTGCWKESFQCLLFNTFVFCNCWGRDHGQFLLIELLQHRRVQQYLSRVLKQVGEASAWKSVSTGFLKIWQV